MLSDEQLNEIEARANAADPGPWPLPGERMGATEPYLMSNANYDERLPLDHEGQTVWPWKTEENMIFAYRAREDVPALIAEIRRLRGLLERS